MGFQSNLLAAGAAVGGAISQVGKSINARNELIAKQKQAMQKAEQVKAAKTEQKKRRNFANYIPHLLEESGYSGVKLNKEQLKSVSGQYSRAQKTEIMNRIDKKMAGGSKK